MIRAIILYYLNIKPTHGYEIQQFISMSGMDQWMKIQSGSIYYALAKLEKEKNISVQREERTGSRVRKIYEITAQGRETLLTEMKQELEAPLFNIGSPKFIISPILSSLSKQEVEKTIIFHIEELRKTIECWKMWGEFKSNGDKYGLTKLSFQMTIESIEQQIVWHEQLLEHLDYYMEEARAMTNRIATFDFEKSKNMEQSSGQNSKLGMLEQLKDALEKNPQIALDQINIMIEQLKSN